MGIKTKTFRESKHRKALHIFLQKTHEYIITRINEQLKKQIIQKIKIPEICLKYTSYRK